MFDNNTKRFTPEQISILRQTPMRDILAAEGYDTTHTRGGLFFSPFREKERTPSLHIDDANHRWFDHGDATLGIGVCNRTKGGGDPVSFVMLLKGLRFLDALEYLCRYNPSVVPEEKVSRISVPQMRDKIIGEGGGRSGDYVGTVIREARTPFLDTALVAFAQGRGIPKTVLERYCKEVYYDMTYRDGDDTRILSHHAIGFPNSDGGWVLRYVSRNSADRGKRSTGGGATLLSKDGELMTSSDAKATSGSVIVFEGFMDFLSWIADKRDGATPRDTDVVVLNSVANLDAALPFILQHGNVIGLLDGDKTGEKTMEHLKNKVTAAMRRFYDWRSLYNGAKDYNEMWQRRCLLAKTA